MSKANDILGLAATMSIKKQDFHNAERQLSAALTSVNLAGPCSGLQVEPTYAREEGRIDILLRDGNGRSILVITEDKARALRNFLNDLYGE